MVDWSTKNIITLTAILLLMASLASALDINELKKRIKKPTGIIIGLICQYGLLPSTAFCLTYLFELPISMKIALIVLSTCPGGSVSNFWCFMFNTDLSLSISMTTASSLLSFAFITGNCALYIPIISDASVQIDYISLLISVGVVIIGIIIGILISLIGNKILLHIMAFTALATMLLIFFYALFGNRSINGRSTKIRDLPPEAFISATILNIFGFIMSFLLAYLFKLKRASIASVAIETSNQNAPLAYSILTLTLPDGIDKDLAINIPILYMILNIGTVILLLSILKISGWLKIDPNDKTRTFAVIIDDIKRQNKKKKHRRPGIIKINSSYVSTNNESTEELNPSQFSKQIMSHNGSINF